MKITFSPDVLKELRQIKQKDRKLSEKIQKQILLFKSNPKHPSLRLHKMSGNKGHAWSISITMSIRILYKIINEETAYFYDLGTHDEVYKK